MSNKWPKLKYETKPWVSSYPPDVLTKREREWIEDHRTYEAAIPFNISKLDVDIPNALRNKIDEALLVIGRFDMLILQKNYSLPLIMLRSESASSSQIEHLTASSRNIALAQLSDDAPSNSKLIANNIGAMKKAMDEAKHFTVSTITEVHKILLDNIKNVDFAGKVRDDQVWIGGSNLGPGDARFVPPVAQKVPAYLDDLIKFGGRGDINSIAKAAILHAQFETIHPFADGNGRTGRTLLHIILKQDEVLLNSALPISAGLLHNVDNYFSALNEYRDGNPLAIIEELCDAIFAAASLGGLMINRIEDMISSWKSQITARKDSSIWDLLDLLIGQPVLDAEYVSSKLNISLRSAYTTIETGLEAGILKKMGNKHRGIFYEARELTKMLDDVTSEDGMRRLVASANY